jgi:hypothetical protein
MSRVEIESRHLLLPMGTSLASIELFLLLLSNSNQCKIARGLVRSPLEVTSNKEIRTEGTNQVYTTNQQQKQETSELDFN